MKNSNGNTVPANKEGDVKAGPVKLDAKAPEIIAAAQRLTLATEEEGKARAAAAELVDKATGSTWDTLRTATVETLKALGHVNAALVLDVYLANAKLAGGIVKARANQYAANLRRMVKAAALGKELPADILTCGRSAYLDHAFWATSGVLAKTGTKAGSGKTANSQNKAKASQATEAAKEMAADAVSQAAAEANEDKGMKKLASMLGQLHGPFRVEAYTECAEVLARILKKQAQASGTGQQ